jgi:putative endonuclease
MGRYYYVYVLRSTRDGKFYVGYTKDVRKRLELHNSGQVESTKRRTPLELIYWEGCINQQDATKREKYLKSSWGKRYIKNRLEKYLGGVHPVR